MAPGRLSSLFGERVSHIKTFDENNPRIITYLHSRKYDSGGFE